MLKNINKLILAILLSGILINFNEAIAYTIIYGIALLCIMLVTLNSIYYIMCVKILSIESLRSIHKDNIYGLFIPFSITEEYIKARETNTQNQLAIKAIVVPIIITVLIVIAVYTMLVFRFRLDNIDTSIRALDTLIK